MFLDAPTVEVRYEPDPRQQSLCFDEPDEGAGEKAEVRHVDEDRGDRDLRIPPELVRLADEIAGKAFRRGDWGDRDDLHSAAMMGVWRSVKKAESLGLEVEDWEKWSASFIWWELRMVRRRQARATAKWRGVFVRLGRKDDIGSWVVDPKPHDPSARSQRNEFWGTALKGLTATQSGDFGALYRDGETLSDIARKRGVSSTTIRASTEWSVSAVVDNLRPINRAYRGR